jgi:hypothetical protein
VAETAAKTTTPRARARKTTTTPAKAAPAKAATAPAKEAPTEDDNTARYAFTMEPAGETKSYAVFSPPKSTGCVGKLYAPLGTEEVKVLLIGPAEVVDPE